MFAGRLSPPPCDSGWCFHTRLIIRPRFSEAPGLSADDPTRAWDPTGDTGKLLPHAPGPPEWWGGEEPRRGDALSGGGTANKYVGRGAGDRLRGDAPDVGRREPPGEWTGREGLG